MPRTPTHPGEHLLEELIHRVLPDLDPDACMRLIKGETAVDIETARALAIRLGTSTQMWLDLQALYDRRIAENATAS